MGETAPTRFSRLEALAQLEPWRYGRYPIPQAEALCPGRVEWEEGKGWWVCSRCGHVGRAPYFGHFAAQVRAGREERKERKGILRFVVAAAAMLAATLTVTLMRR